MNARAAAILAALTIMLAACGSSLQHRAGIVPPPFPEHPPAPVSKILPAITGTPTFGQTLIASSGTWSNNPRFYSLQWRRCDSTGASCTNIAGATNQVYLLASADTGSTLRVQATVGNVAGSTVASSPQTAVVSGPPPVSGVGTGPSKALCSPSCTTSSWNETGTAFTTNDGAGKNVTEYYWLNVPTGLVTNDASHPVPLVITFPMGCVKSNLTLPTITGAGCLLGSHPGDTPDTWWSIAAAQKLVVMVIYGDNNGGYMTPTVYGTPAPGARSCGPSGTGACDQAYEVAAAIQDLKNRGYQLDPSMIFATGGSKGGSMSNDVACSTVTEPLLAGVAAGSTIMGTSGNNASYPPAGLKNVGSCPAWIVPGTTSPIANAHKLMMQWWFSAIDGVYNTCPSPQGVDGVAPIPNVCLDGGGVGTSGYWIYSQPEQAVHMAAPAFGCTATPSRNTIGNGSVVVNTYAACNPAEVQVVDYTTSGCHGDGCNNQEGTGLRSSMTWDFWTTGSKTP